MSTTAKRSSSSSSNGQDRASTLEELAAFRAGDYYTAPSGFTFKLRFLNLERHALAGGLPPALRALAAAGQRGIDELFESDDSLNEKGVAAQEWLDYIVRQLVIEPELPPGDLDVYILPADFRWLVKVGMGEETFDGEGAPLWGRQRLTRFRESGRK